MFLAFLTPPDEESLETGSDVTPFSVIEKQKRAGYNMVSKRAWVGVRKREQAFAGQIPAAADFHVRRCHTTTCRRGETRRSAGLGSIGGGTRSVPHPRSTFALCHR